MKYLLAVAMLASFPLALMAQTTHVKFSQNGAFANVDVTPDPLSNIAVQVSRGTTTSLFFSSTTFAADFNSITFTQIFGTIPDADFTGENTHGLSLNVDTTQLDPSTSTSQTCTLDLTTFTFTCGPAPAGVIQIDFRENGAQRTRILALESVTTSGPLTTRVHQRSDNGSANAQGTALGTPISSVSATIGVNHQSTLEITTN